MSCARAKSLAIFARENDIITCERGHPLYRITRDMMRNAYCFDTISFEPIGVGIPLTLRGTHVRQTCAKCGSAWVHGPDGLLGNIEVHFEDGWR